MLSYSCTEQHTNLKHFLCGMVYVYVWYMDLCGGMGNTDVHVWVHMYVRVRVPIHTR